MKTISATAIVALMTATLGFTAIAPAFAQESASVAAPQQQTQNFRNHNNEHGGPRQGGGFGDLLNFGRGAEGVEIALVRLSHAIELTAEQQPLFDAFKTAAIGAAEDLSTALEGLRPTAPAEGETATVPDFSDRLENRIAIETAQLAALEAVQPSATAFFDSLTDEQKASLMPQRPDRDGGPGFGNGGPREGGQHWGQQGGKFGGGHGQHGGPQGGQPGAAPQPPAPPAPPAEAPANG